ncbi:hypothetical protein [Microbacterium sp.]|uniref:DUF7674 family protein n=1 Tax=Microbacterium sp. TaxID=51671 RepID=UPI0039E35D10
MKAWRVAAISALVYEHPLLIPLLEEHLNEFDGEVLAHLLLSDIVRWMVANLESHPDAVQSILDWWDSEYQKGPDEVRELIFVSGVEMIPDPGQPGANLRNLMSEALRADDPWLQ